jgi:hypothetical protein
VAEKFSAETEIKKIRHFIKKLLYEQLLSASRDTEAELVCVDKYGKKSGMGVLSGGGFLFTVPLNVIRKLLNKVNLDFFFFFLHGPPEVPRCRRS